MGVLSPTEAVHVCSQTRATTTTFASNTGSDVYTPLKDILRLGEAPEGKERRSTFCSIRQLRFFF